MNHSAADVIRYLLIALGLGTRPASSLAWPIFVGVKPDTPDNCIVVRDTTPITHGRDMTSGEVLKHDGFQVTVRSADYVTGHTKARDIEAAMAEVIYQDSVAIAGTSYLVDCVSRIGGVLPIGEEETSKRHLFTINAVVSVRQLP